MADKTTTLKTKTNDNVYPNIIGDNRDNAIVNSAHINHTLTKDHKINFRLDTNVSGLIFNSLQKPAGLTKTELVGVGTNGQENIEIGDNLTLANGKLSATGGSVPARYYTHFIILTNDNDRIYFQFTDNNDEDYSMSILSQVINQKKMVCTGVLGNSDESLATPLYVSGQGDIEVYYVLKSDTSGTIYHKSIRSFTISQSRYPIDYQF